MLTDRELLELAAKAVGEVQGDWVGNTAYLDGVLSRWNPLEDDGDALRLAVKLGQIGCLRINWGCGAVSAEDPTHRPFSMLFACEEMDAADPCAATRRAIVRAAAEIQRAKENNDADR